MDFGNKGMEGNLFGAMYTHLLFACPGAGET